LKKIYQIPDHVKRFIETSILEKNLSDNIGVEDPTFFGFNLFIDFDGLGSPLFNETGVGESASVYLKNKREYDRLESLKRAKMNLKNLIQKYPYFIKQIEGLKEIYKFDENGIVNKKMELEITTMESLDWKIASIIEDLARIHIDFEYSRQVLPVNLRWFTCYIIVSEIRNLRSFIEKSEEKDYFGMTDINKYLNMFVYKLQKCTFDISASNPFLETLKSDETEQATNFFKINVSKSKILHKISFNNLFEINTNRSNDADPFTKTKPNLEKGGFLSDVSNLYDQFGSRLAGPYETANMDIKQMMANNSPSNLIKEASQRLINVPIGILESLSGQLVLGNVFSNRSEILQGGVGSIMAFGDALTSSKSVKDVILDIILGKVDPKSSGFVKDLDKLDLSDKEKSELTKYDLDLNIQKQEVKLEDLDLSIEKQEIKLDNLDLNITKTNIPIQDINLEITNPKLSMDAVDLSITKNPSVPLDPVDLGITNISFKLDDIDLGITKDPPVPLDSVDLNIVKNPSDKLPSIDLNIQKEKLDLNPIDLKISKEKLDLKNLDLGQFNKAELEDIKLNLTEEDKTKFIMEKLELVQTSKSENLDKIELTAKKEEIDGLSVINLLTNEKEPIELDKINLVGKTALLELEKINLTSLNSLGIVLEKLDLGTSHKLIDALDKLKLVDQARFEEIKNLPNVKISDTIKELGEVQNIINRDPDSMTQILTQNVDKFEKDPINSTLGTILLGTKKETKVDE